MKWGFFTIAHIVSLLIAIVLNISIYFILRNKTDKTKTITLFVLSLTGIAAIIFNLLKWDSPLEYLPLHMCSINALLLPIAVLTKNKTLSNLLLLWCLGAFVALIMNNSVMETELFSLTFNFYYFPHVFECGIPILLFALKLTKLDAKCILSTVIITMILYTGIHFANISLNNYFVENNIVNIYGDIITVNYMFSINPDNPLLMLFYKIIPFNYWYMYCVIPVIIVYLSLIYVPVKFIKPKNESKVSYA